MSKILQKLRFKTTPYRGIQPCKKGSVYCLCTNCAHNTIHCFNCRECLDIGRIGHPNFTLHSHNAIRQCLFWKNGKMENSREII